jgi:superkiller protein 3
MLFAIQLLILGENDIKLCENQPIIHCFELKYYFCELKFQRIETMAKKYKTKQELAQKCFDEAKSYYGKGDFDKEIECYRKAIEYKPDYAEAYLEMGWAYNYSKYDFDKAIECYQKAIDYKHDYAAAYYEMGLAYDYFKQDYDKAIKCYQKAKEIEPYRTSLDGDIERC